LNGNTVDQDRRVPTVTITSHIDHAEAKDTDNTQIIVLSLSP